MKQIILCLLAMLLASGAVSAQLDNYASFPKDMGAPVRADIVVTSLNNTLQKEIIVSPDNRQIFVFNPDGTLKWNRIAGQESTFDYGRTPAVVDINGDNNKEIITYGNPSSRNADGTYAETSSPASLYIWDNNGNQLKTIPVGTNMILTPPLVADIGEKIIIVGASPGGSNPYATTPRGIYAYDVSGSKLWDYDIGPAVRTVHNAVGDIDGDNKDEAAVIVMVNDYEFKLVILKPGKTGASILWEKNVGSLISGAAIGDINNDGKNDVVIGSGKGVYAWNGNGSLIWHNPDPVVTNSPPAIGDINGDGINDVVIGSDQQKKVYAISQGNMMQGFPVATKQSVWSRPALSDINGNGKLEIVAGDFSGFVYGWDYTGKVLNGFPIKPSASGFMSSPVVVDLTGTGKYQVIMGNDDRKLYAWQVKLPVAPVAIISSPSNVSVYQLNSPVEFISSSTDEDGTIVSYKWSSDKDGLIGTESSFTAITLSAGWHNITLTVTDNDGLTAAALVKIKINKPPAAAITTPLSGDVFSQTDVTAFSGTAADEDGTIDSYLWSSDIDGVIGTQGSVTSSSLSVGVHNITFTITDNDGASASEVIQAVQKGYDVNWNLQKKPVLGDLSMFTSQGFAEHVYKTGSMVAIKFTISENGVPVIDKTVQVSVYDPAGMKVFNAVYGNGSKSVRINEEDGKYIANFKSHKNDLAGTYRLEVTFDSQRPNQDFSGLVSLIGQDGTYFVNRVVNIKPAAMGESFDYEWKLGDAVIGTGRELNWLPAEAGIYNIQLTVVKNTKQTAVENFIIVVNGEADANGDDAINVLDLSLLGINWGKTSDSGDFDDAADVNGDGVIDISDAVKIGKKWS
jgi:hypothetical protein